MKFFKFKKKKTTNSTKTLPTKSTVDIKTPPKPVGNSKTSKTTGYYSKNSKTVHKNNSKSYANNYKAAVYSKKYDAYYEQMMMLQYWKNITKEADMAAKLMRDKKREPDKPKVPSIIPVIF